MLIQDYFKHTFFPFRPQETLYYQWYPLVHTFRRITDDLKSSTQTTTINTYIKDSILYIDFEGLTIIHSFFSRDLVILT